MKHQINRRQLLLQAGQSGAVLAGTVGVTAAQAAPSTAQGPPRRKRVLRIAHITDVHVQPGDKSAAGMAACLDHIHRQRDKCDFILNGGDCIMDAMGRRADVVQAQWDTWNQVLDAHCKLPIYHCIGNHDIWGIMRKPARATGKEKLFGKAWAVKELGMPGRFYSFDRNGWHFIVLDSVVDNGKGGYLARLDSAQFKWLSEDLDATPPTKPVLVLSHVPIFCACALFNGRNEKDDHWEMSGGWMHLDARRIKDLFYKHPNVRLAISGHMHLLDRVDYNRVTYLCNGAVCGAWWNGNFQETKPGYSLITLYDDGFSTHRYVTYP